MPPTSSASRPSKPAILFLASFFAFVALGSLSLWVSAHGYSDPAAVNLLNRSYAAAAAPATLLRQAAWSYPPLPIFLQATLSLLPGLHANLPVNLLSALCASFLLAGLYLEMSRLTSPLRSVFWTLLFAMHPFFLWAATSSLVATIALSSFLALALSVLRIARYADARSFLAFSFVLTLYMLNCSGGFLLFLLLLLLFPAFLPDPIRRSSVSAGYIAAFLIPVSAILCGVYMSWVFHKRLDSFSELPPGIIHAAFPVFSPSDYLYRFVILMPLVSALIVLVPVSRFAQLAAIDKRALLTTLCLPVIPLFAFLFRPVPPMDTLVLFAALPAATLIRFLRQYKHFPALGSLLLLASAVASVALLVLFPVPEMQSWLVALSGTTDNTSVHEVVTLVPWLVLASALFVAAIGATLLRRPNA